MKSKTSFEQMSLGGFPMTVKNTFKSDATADNVLGRERAPTKAK